MKDLIEVAIENEICNILGPAIRAVALRDKKITVKAVEARIPAGKKRYLDVLQAGIKTDSKKKDS